MAFITVTGEPGCRDVELAQVSAQRLGCPLLGEADLAKRITAEFGESIQIPDRAWRPLAVSVLVSLGGKGHVVVCGPGAELFSHDLPGVVRFHVTAPESIRLRNLMQDCGLDHAAAKARLRELASATALIRKRRFGQKMSHPTDFDLVLNAEKLSAAEMAELLETAVRSQGLLDSAPLTGAAVADIQFHVRLQLARFGIVPPKQTDLERKELAHPFGHPSEEVFANLLDFYGISWDYEPRSFPLQWDKDGKVSEAFTPDFYLPEFDLYVELTTMKQAHVTKKNRKVRLLRIIYPHVNIQVFYQKDVQDLVMKYGLPEHLAR
ncbi:MAG TPA: cytidylate kinase family protein [Bryobacteraceae bacterium]|nr:cytidylate kinase family protein [Bryobacteraceae bacterium]